MEGKKDTMCAACASASSIANSSDVYVILLAHPAFSRILTKNPPDQMILKLAAMSEFAGAVNFSL